MSTSGSEAFKLDMSARTRLNPKIATGMLGLSPLTYTPSMARLTTTSYDRIFLSMAVLVWGPTLAPKRNKE